MPRRLPALLPMLSLALGLAAPAGAAERVVLAPPPVEDLAAPAAGGLQTTVLAGGCFWGVQAVFQHLDGVTEAVSGYAGDSATNAHYKEVSLGLTRHAEAVRVTWDPARISYGIILQVFFSVAHDPTQLDRQGPDTGPQYRSALFPRDDEQRRIAERYVAQLDKAGLYPAPIVTRLEGAAPFFSAEPYHQDYATLHPHEPYIVINDRPKVEALQRLFPARYRAQPVLVGANGPRPQG